jgi:uncharacterized protein
MNEIIGFIGAICIGIVLGITGGGGSILTVPILVYIININPIIATAYSLFIVGITSGFGALQNYRKGLVSIKTALLYAFPSLIGVYITRKFIVPSIPDTIFKIQNYSLTKGTFLMMFFGIIMFFAAISMLKTKKESISNQKQKAKFYIIVIQNFIVGILMGLIGAGGGFLIIPVLVHFAKLPMKKAIGTSLLIITINSLIGFTGDLQNISIDWTFLLKFTSLSVIGIFIGVYLHKYINENVLKKLFGWFVLLMSITIILKEIIS